MGKAGRYTFAAWAAVTGLMACTPSTAPRDAAPVVEDEPELEPDPEPAAEPVAEPEAEREPEPEPEAEPEPEPEPEQIPQVRAAKGFPKNVHAAYVDPERGWTVDKIDPWGRRHERVWKALGLEELDNVEDFELEPRGPGVPRGWKHGDVWTLITRQGVMRRRVARFGLDQGPGEVHLRIELRRARGVGRATALAIRGTDVPDDLRLRKPERAPDSDIDRGWLRDTIVTAAKDREDRRMFRKARIQERHVKVFRARLPPPYTDVVVLDAPVRGDEDGGRASALVVRSSADAYVRASDYQGRIKIVSVLDINRDGVDEIVFNDSYYEGDYDHLLYFEGGKPKVRTLSGDGA